jgi:hypothetical protein
MGAAYDLTGRVFGKLTVRSAATRKKYWCTDCECGGSSEVRADHLIGGKIRSCGHCVPSMSGHPLYKTWIRMIDRCTNPKAHNYRWYGAKGVTVCDRWLNSFALFISDVGERPVGTTLDRFPDKNGGYEPNNFRWATQTDARNNLLFEVDGVTKTLKQWSRVEVSRGKSLAEAVSIAREVASSGRRKTRSNSREKEVCSMLKRGSTTKEILAAIDTSAPTISRCRRLLGITRGQLATAQGQSSQQAIIQAEDTQQAPPSLQEADQLFSHLNSNSPEDDVRYPLK